MKIIKGRYAGKTATLHQHANDWMTVDIPGERPGIIVKPTMVQLDEDEQERMHADRRRAEEGSVNSGHFWTLWELRGDGTFSKRTR